MSASDDLQPFRQPLVTASGIILGFVLNSASSFVRTDSDVNDGVAYGIGSLMLAGIVCLIIVLARALRMDYPRDSAKSFYHRTLILFLAGVSLSFAGALLDMWTHFSAE